MSRNNITDTKKAEEDKREAELKIELEETARIDAILEERCSYTKETRKCLTEMQIENARKTGQKLITDYFN